MMPPCSTGAAHRFVMPAIGQLGGHYTRSDPPVGPPPAAYEPLVVNAADGL
jgi:hypothetical protein